MPLKSAITDRNVMARVDTEKVARVIELDAVYCDIRFFKDIDACGRIAYYNFLVTIIGEGDTVAIGGTRIDWPDSLLTYMPPRRYTVSPATALGLAAAMVVQAAPLKGASLRASCQAACPSGHTQ